MKVTLSLILETGDIDKQQNILKVKHMLSRYKKRGLLFFRENVTELTSLTPFEMYCYIKPNVKTVKNAFPVPHKALQYHQDRMMQFEFMRTFFESYYEVEIDNLTYFKDYDYKHPYVGTIYLWYFK